MSPTPSRKRLLSIAIILMIMVSVSAVGVSRADSATTSTIASTEGAYVDPSMPATNWNNGLIFISGNGVGGASNIGLLKFDLSTVGYSINKARLNLAVLNDVGTCNVSSDTNTLVSIYQVDNTSWDEATVTYASLPSRGAFIMSATTGGTVPSHLGFTDAASGNLSTFLETERTAGFGSDQIAGLWIETTATFAQIVFEDDEGTGAGASCPGADLVPTLQLADAAAPLAVTLSSLMATSSLPGSLPLYVLLVGAIGLIGLLASAALIRFRR